VVNADHVFNCIGPSMRVSESADPLIRSMLETGEATTEPESLGLSADAAGRLRRRDGSVSSSVLVLGALRRGDLWESTAVPELRAQAAAVGSAIREEFLADAVRADD